MIRFEEVTVTYPGAPAPTLAGVDLAIDEGTFALVVGPTGSGKSTLLGAVNGLVPHFTGGHLVGRVSVDGRATATHPPRDLADLVGVVGQDPLAGFTTDTVEEELAYGMEQLGFAPEVMRRRVEETLDLVSIAELRHRSLSSLSGGQAQRVAVASVLTAGPRVLVLDEPTSALDPGAAEEVLAALLRLVHDLGITALVAEHRLERVIHYADHLITLDGTGTVETGPPATQVRRARVAPPVVRLGELAGWDPLPLSVRDARQRAGPLRAELADAAPPAGPTHPQPACSGSPGRAEGDDDLIATGVVVRHRDVMACAGVDVSLAAGTVTAVMGRNGSGKSSLLWALSGAGPRQGGSVTVAGTEVGDLRATEARRRVGLVPQTPADLLYLDTVAAELAQADADADAPTGTADALLDRLVPGVVRQAHPRDGSEGEKLALALAIQLTAGPPVVLLDEPTRGLDYHAKTRLGTVLGELATEGRAIAVSTHDVEFVAEVADRVIILAGGEVVAEGPTAEVIAASPAFAPQVAKILAPQRWLTVTGVAGVLDAR